MRAVERLTEVIRTLPVLTRIGLGALLIGFAVDLVAHAGWPEGATVGHVVTLAGMGLAVAGVLTVAFRNPEAHVSDGRGRK